ncbi:ATP-grasp domain-containing protein [Catellatospora sichuanensis]|uniref:ATP-grasp domain-containing protein n=1 Tax=Catellatospora sichuanensis TaxID=1969805 RepID=UPI00118439F9|nr:ATP-grasp domain-containing protein [Catellatospora sichuanensis]
MNVDTILIIGGRLDTVRKAKDLGLRVVYLQQQELHVSAGAAVADAVLLADYTDWSIAEPLVAAAQKIWGFTQVVSLAERAMELVGRINDMFALGGTSYAVSHLFKNKLAMREHLAATGTEVVAAQAVDSADQLRAFGERHGFPIVVKPVDAAGSLGVMIVDGPERIDEVWRTAQGLRGRADREVERVYPVDRFIVEEYIDGPEYSVESFSFAGRHIIVGITEKLSAGVVEMGHAEPARLTPDAEAALVTHVEKFLGCMGLRDGIACTEVKMSTKGPRIVESQNRAPGDRVMDLVEQVSGFDMESYAVGWPFRLLPELTERPHARCAAATRFLLAEPGTVVSIKGAEEVRDHPGVLDVDISVQEGGDVPVLADNFDRIGQILTTAADTTTAIELCDTLIARIRISTVASGT